MSIQNNISKIYTIKFFTMFLVLMPVIVPFFQSSNIGMRGVYLLQTIFAITVFIFEIPSGYISDILGRKRTLVVGHLLKGIGFSLFPFAQDLNLLIVAEVILGVAVSLNSGTDTALLYDTLDLISPKKAHIKVLGKSIFFQTFGEGCASLVSSVLLIMSVSMHSLAIISALISWVPLVISFTLIEPERKKMNQSHKENFKSIYNRLFKESRLLNLIILNSIMSFSATMFAVWIFQKYWKDLGVPLVYFGFLWALTNFTTSYFSRKAHLYEKRWGSSLIIIIVGLLPIVGYLGISMIDHFIGILSCLLFQTSRGLGQVIFKDALNKRVTGEFRATANSISQMGVRIFFGIVGPFLGWYIDLQGLSQATLLMGAFYLLVFLFFIIPLLKERGSYIHIIN